MQLLECIFRCVCGASTSQSDSVQFRNIEAKSNTLHHLFREGGRSNDYFKQLYVLAVKIQEYEYMYHGFDYRSLNNSDDVVIHDLQQLTALLKLLSEKSPDIERVKRECADLMSRGFTLEFLNDLTGDVLDLELLSEDAIETKFREYVALFATKNECAICFEQFKRDTVKIIHRTACHHFFCTDCLRQSVAVKPECPVCRATVTWPRQYAQWQRYQTLISTRLKAELEVLPEVEEEDTATKAHSHEINTQESLKDILEKQSAEVEEALRMQIRRDLRLARRLAGRDPQSY